MGFKYKKSAKLGSFRLGPDEILLGLHNRRWKLPDKCPGGQTALHTAFSLPGSDTVRLVRGEKESKGTGCLFVLAAAPAAFLFHLIYRLL